MGALLDKIKLAQQQLLNTQNPDMEDPAYLPNEQLGGRGMVNLFNAANELQPDPISIGTEPISGEPLNFMPIIGKTHFKKEILPGFRLSRDIDHPNFKRQFYTTAGQSIEKSGWKDLKAAMALKGIPIQNQNTIIKVPLENNMGEVSDSIEQLLGKVKDSNRILRDASDNKGSLVELMQANRLVDSYINDLLKNISSKGQK